MSVDAAAPAHHGFHNFKQAVAFWRQQCPVRAGLIHIKWSDVDAYDLKLLQKFSECFCKTADFAHPAATPQLAGRVYGLLQSRDANPKLRLLCMDCKCGALQECRDRIPWALNQAQTAVRVFYAEHGASSGAELKQFVLSLMRLEIVQAHARRKISTLWWPDRIEVYLAYEAALRVLLALPVSAKSYRWRQ